MKKFYLVAGAFIFTLPITSLLILICCSGRGLEMLAVLAIAAAIVGCIHFGLKLLDKAN